ncbi:MAG: S-adenosylmethionine:tRNA ribosyltransferase-isomerase, partial [Polymorphobacter sp.]
EIDADTAAAIRAAKDEGRRVIAVGTTSARLLESAWTPEGVQAFSADTRIFITPGFKFAVVDGLLTNFHLPKSTLFMLVSALMGLDTMKAAYGHAVAHDYRFYSYGDASLLLP